MSGSKKVGVTNSPTITVVTTPVRTSTKAGIPSGSMTPAPKKSQPAPKPKGK